MTKLNLSCSWSWTLLNQQGQECLVLEDMKITASCEAVGPNDFQDFTVLDVQGDRYVRVGLSHSYMTSDLPDWLREKALEAARAELGDTSGALYQLLLDDAREEYDEEIDDSDTDPDREEA